MAKRPAASKESRSREKELLKPRAEVSGLMVPLSNTYANLNQASFFLWPEVLCSTLSDITLGALHEFSGLRCLVKKYCHELS